MSLNLWIRETAFLTGEQGPGRLLLRSVVSSSKVRKLRRFMFEVPGSISTNGILRWFFQPVHLATFFLPPGMYSLRQLFPCSIEMEHSLKLVTSFLVGQGRIDMYGDSWHPHVHTHTTPTSHFDIVQTETDPDSMELPKVGGKVSLRLVYKFQSQTLAFSLTTINTTTCPQ